MPFSIPAAAGCDRIQQRVLYDQGVRAASLPRIVRRRSAVHGHGVFAAETIAKNTRIIDYAGELVRNGEECEAREARYLEQGCIWVFRVNRAGKVVWRHLTSKISHDADLLPNGNVLYVDGWDSRSDAQAYEVDPSGKIVWSWSAAGKVDPSWHRPVTIERRPSYAHTNAAVRLPNGDTLISMRNFNRVVRVTPEGEIRRVFERPGVQRRQDHAGSNVVNRNTERAKLKRH